MKRLIVVVFLVVAAAAIYRSFGSAETGTGTLTLPGPAPNANETAPSFVAETMEGERFVLDDEGLYVLTFWSTLNLGSSDARDNYFSRLADEYADEGVSFAVVYVNSAPRDSDAPYAMLQDSTGKLSSLYNVKRVPRLFLIENGEVRLVQNGYYEQNGKDLEEALQSTLQKKS